LAATTTLIRERSAQRHRSRKRCIGTDDVGNGRVRGVCLQEGPTAIKAEQPLGRVRR
jgi:hypothetical protein